MIWRLDQHANWQRIVTPYASKKLAPMCVTNDVCSVHTSPDRAEARGAWHAISSLASVELRHDGDGELVPGFAVLMINVTGCLTLALGEDEREHLRYFRYVVLLKTSANEARDPLQRSHPHE